MGILENLKQGFDMAKQFRRKSFRDTVAKKEEIPVETIEQRVVEEESGPEDKMTKEEFLISKGMQDRPNSIMALTAWEEYNES